MSSPGAAQITVRPDLRGSVVNVWDTNGERANFIADLAGSRIDVPFAAGTIRRIPREAFTKDPLTLDRGPDGSYGRGEWGDNVYTYFTKEQAQEMPVDKNMAAQTSLYYDAEVAAGRIAMSRVLRGHEKLVAGLIMNSTTFTGATLTAAAAANWRTNSGSAVPIQDIKTGRQNVRQNCGREANTLILDWIAYEALRETSQIVGRITGGATTADPAQANIQDVARICQIDRIIVARGIQDTTKQGQTFIGSGIWNSTMAMVAYINPMASLQDINLCNVYNWEGDGGSFDWTVESYLDIPTRRDIVRVRRQVGAKVEYPECGFLLTGVA